MQFLRDSEEVAEQELEVFFNASGETIQRGYPVQLGVVTFVDTNGVNVIKAVSTAQANLFAGVAYEDFLPGAYGRVQVTGFCDYALVANHSANATLAGDAMVPVAGQWYLQRSTAGVGVGALCTAMEAIAANAVITPAARKVFLRCR